MREQQEDEYKSFEAARAHIAQELAELVDRSTKGSIDTLALPFLSLFNVHPDWITTSTCSGRLVSYLPGSGLSIDGAEKPLTVNGKGGGDWLFVSHSTLSSAQLASPISTLLGGRAVEMTRSGGATTSGDARIVHLTYQAPVLHLMARSVTVAAPVLRAAIGAGFRNSGLTLGQRGRVILAVRSSTGGLDVPIARLTVRDEREVFELLVEEDYLSELLRMGDELMSKNKTRLDRLLAAFESALKLSKPPLDWEPADDRRRRMKAEGLAARSKVIPTDLNDPMSDQLNEDQILDATHIFNQ